MKNFLAALLLAGAAGLVAAAPVKIAIFGSNNIATFLGASASNDVDVVTDTQLASSGFLDPYDLFIYTRDAGEFGLSLSTSAAAAVSAFVTGNVVLFASDLQDNLPTDNNAQALLTNAVGFAGNKGFIGELIGACAAMSSIASSVSDQDGDPIAALALITGSCDSRNEYLVADGYGDPIKIIQTGHPVVDGISQQINLGSANQFLYVLSLANQNEVIAVNKEDLPAIVATEPNTAVPEPASLALIGLGLAAVAMVRRRG